MNTIIPLQGAGERTSIRSALIRAGMWNVQQLAQDSGVSPIDIMAVLYNQIVSSQVVYHLVCVLNNIKGSGQWMLGGAYE